MLLAEQTPLELEFSSSIDIAWDLDENIRSSTLCTLEVFRDNTIGWGW